MDDGEMDGLLGYWVEDELTGYVGFLPEFEDVFSIFDDTSDAWLPQPFKGRRMRSGNPKGKG